MAKKQTAGKNPAGKNPAGKNQKAKEPKATASMPQAPETIPASDAPAISTEEISAQPEETACTPEGEAVSLEHQPAIKDGTEGAKKMQTLTLKGLDKRGRNGIYVGGPVSIRIPVGAFPDKTAPASIQVEGVGGPKEKRAPETKEERKARLAAQPKPTLAEKIAKREAQLAALRAKAAAETPAEQTQPAM
jgi:hypothetical protein